MSNTLKDIILFKRSTEDVITNITSDKVLTGEVVLINESGKERLWTKNSNNEIVPIHRILNGEEIVVQP